MYTHLCESCSINPCVICCDEHCDYCKIAKRIESTDKYPCGKMFCPALTAIFDDADEKMSEILADIRSGNAENLNISYASDDLIAEVEEDIAELGANEQVFVWARYLSEYNTAVAVDYDFIDATIRKEDIDEDESVGITTLGELLMQLKKQNKIIQE